MDVPSVCHDVFIDDLAPRFEFVFLVELGDLFGGHPRAFEFIGLMAEHLVGFIDDADIDKPKMDGIDFAGRIEDITHKARCEDVLGLNASFFPKFAVHAGVDILPFVDMSARAKGVASGKACVAAQTLGDERAPLLIANDDIGDDLLKGRIDLRLIAVGAGEIGDDLHEQRFVDVSLTNVCAMGGGIDMGEIRLDAGSGDAHDLAVAIFAMQFGKGEGLVFVLVHKSSFRLLTHAVFDGTITLLLELGGVVVEHNRLVDLTPDVAHALSAIPQAYNTIMRVYNKNRPRFFAAAQASPLKNSSILKQGRAERQIMGLRVLGILSAGTDAEINMVFRAADRKCYDQILEKGNRGETIILEQHINTLEDSDTVFNKIIIFLGWCAKRKFNIERTETIETVLTHIAYKRDTIAQGKKEAREISNEEACQIVRSHLGADECVGIDELYDVCNDHVRDVFEPLCLLFNREELDAGTYTDGIRLTRKDATCIASSTCEETATNAFLLLLIRALKKDKEFCLSMYRDDKLVDIENAHIERDKAMQAAEAAQKQIEVMKDSLRALEKKYEDAQREVESYRGDADEIISLRNALYRAIRPEDVREEKKAEREIPPGTIGIGGHPSWARELSKETGIKIWPSGTTCPQSVLSSAPEVWIQPAYMDHSSFYAAIKTVRKANVPVRYFSSTGVVRCVAEMRSK